MAPLSSPRRTALDLFYAGVVFELGLGLLALGLAWLLDVELLGRMLPVRSWQLLQGGATAGGMIAGAWLLAQLRWEPLEEIFRQIVRLLGPLLRHGRWWHWATISLAAGWGEELLFRGLLQAKLQEHLGLWPAVAVASGVFGALHFITPVYFLLATLIAGVLGLVFHYSGSLVPVILAHALYDLWALWYLSRRYRREFIQEETSSAKPAVEDEAGPHQGKPP